MKKNVFLLVFIGLFLGLGSTYFWYDKVFTTIDTNEYLLKWDLYKEHEDKLNSIISSILVDENELGIYKSKEVKVSELLETEKARIIYDYAYTFDFIKDNSYITYEKFNEISYKIFGNSNYTFDEVNLGNGLYLERNAAHKRYDLIERTYDMKENYFVQGNGIKGAYQKEDLIYFDIPVTFVKSDQSGKLSYSKDITFTNIYCEKDCINKYEYVTYRIYFKEEETTGNYFFNKVSKEVSE